MHLFEQIPGGSVTEVLENWRWFNATRPHRAVVGGEVIAEQVEADDDIVRLLSEPRRCTGQAEWRASWSDEY